MIRQALDKKGLTNLKDAAKALGISPELLRVTIKKGHIPKDKTLTKIASKLELDRTAMILTAHQEKVPEDVKTFFLVPTLPKNRQWKRVYPLSQEQCDYLEKIMSPQEIQLIRKIRQVTEEAKTQIIGYIDFMFSSRKPGV
jgi:DNA-binding phage protein